MSHINVIFYRILLPLPTKTKEGLTILLGQFGLWDPHVHNMEVIMKYSMMISEVMTLEDETVTIAGFVLINNMTDSSVKHLTAFTPTIAKKSAIFMQVLEKPHYCLHQ